MTEEEHKARAMLMGMTYVPAFGYYRKLLHPGVYRVDALTLAEVTSEQARERQNTHPAKDIWYD